MATILIRNGTVLTMDPTRSIVKEGAVLVEGNTIVAVGKADALGSRSADVILEAWGKIVMPGLIDGHTHHTQMLARGLGDDVDLVTWVYERILPYEALLDEETAYLSALLCGIEMIRTGTTCACDPGGYRMGSVAQALADLGMRGVISWAGMDRWSPERPLPEGLPGKLSTEDTLRVEEELVKRWHGDAGGRIRASYALRVEPNVSDELVTRMKALADRDGVLLQMHAAVTPAQVEMVRCRTGRSTIAHLQALGVLGPNWLLSHMGVLTDDELLMLRDHDVKVCHVPGCALHGGLGVISNGKFPEMVAMGITVALGCDASAANNSLDMFRAMYQAATVHKEARQIPDLIPPEKALEMATIDGARALQWEREIGSLEVGKKADLIVVDCARSNWAPLHDFSLVSTLVYSGEGADVEAVIIDGRVVMADRKITTVDVEAVTARAQQVAAALVRRLPYRIEPKWPVV